MFKLFPKKQINHQDVSGKRFFIIRNTLNVLFMICAIAGMLLYIFGTNENLGIITMITAVFLKMAESSLRLLKK